MKKVISEKFVEKAILKHLAKKGWDYNEMITKLFRNETSDFRARPRKASKKV